jgi:hypothetical protein
MRQCHITHRNFICSTAPSWVHISYLLRWYCESHNRISCVRHPSWWVILQHIYCTDIVSHTTEFHVSDTPIMMSYIAAYLLYWYCESHIVISCVRQPHRDGLYLLYWYCETYDGILFVRHPHRDGLYCSIFIVLILWDIQRNFICSTPWLYCIIFVVSILWHINRILFVRHTIMMGYIAV